MLEEISRREGKYAYYTAKDKRIIMKDWEEALNQPLSRVKRLELGNRIGPLVMGVYLNMASYSLYYVPEYYVHNLCREFPGMTVTLHIKKSSIDPEKHNERYIKAAEAIKEEAYIPLGGDLSIDQLISCYERYFEKLASVKYPGHFCEYEDLVMVCGWTRIAEKIEYVLKRVYKDLKVRPEGYFKDDGGFENWFKKLEKTAWDGDRLDEIFRQELVEHKLESLPERKILF